MKQWLEKYGCDADGNRGQMVTMFELDNSKQEREDIAELLAEANYTAEDEGGATVVLDGIEIDVEIDEYYVELRAIEFAIMDGMNKVNCDTHEAYLKAKAEGKDVTFGDCDAD